MHRRQLLIITSTALVTRPVSALTFFAISLADAAITLGVAIVAFFFEKLLPTSWKSSVLKGLFATSAIALGLTEFVERLKHKFSSDSLNAAIGQSVTVDLSLANKDPGRDVASPVTLLALRDTASGRLERTESISWLRLAPASALHMTVTVNKLESTGIKDVVLLSEGRVVGSSPLIKVVA